MRVLLLTAPMVQLNTPYPATAYLAGFLRLHADELGLEIAQADPALELFLRLFSRDGLARVRAALAGRGSAPARWAPSRRTRIATSRPSTRSSVSCRGARRASRPASCAASFSPKGRGSRRSPPRSPRATPRTRRSPPPTASSPLADRAKHLASLYVDDVADAIRDGIDPRFELSRYAEKLAESAASFDPLAAALDGPPTLVDELTDAIGAELAARHRPDVVGISAPFPGNVYGAFRLARAIRRARPAARMVLGGGYVNTELRELGEPRVFDSFDYVTLDDGERPLLSLLRHLGAGGAPGGPLHRTFVRENGRVVLKTDPAARDVPPAETGTPTYAGLPLDRYVSLFEMLNPMHRLWSDGRWNKLTLAHGCYWKKCTFCDVSLPYIGRYEAASADLIVDRIVALVDETGETGFHFVDEAAPPAMLRALSERLLERGVRDHLVGEHPVREDLHPRALRADGARRLHRRHRRAGGRLQPAARADEEGGHRRAGGARDPRLHRRGRHGPRLPDVWLSDGDRAGDDRRARAGAPAVRRGLHPVGVLAPLRRHRAQPDRHAPAQYGIRVKRRAWRPSRATSCRSSTPPAPTTTSWARGCARRSTTTCTGWGWTSTSVPGFLRPSAGRRRARRKVPAAKVPADLIAKALAS